MLSKVYLVVNMNCSELWEVMWYFSEMKFAMHNTQIQKSFSLSVFSLCSCDEAMTFFVCTRSDCHLTIITLIHWLKIDQVLLLMIQLDGNGGELFIEIHGGRRNWRYIEQCVVSLHAFVSVSWETYISANYFLDKKSCAAFFPKALLRCPYVKKYTLKFYKMWTVC